MNETLVLKAVIRQLFHSIAHLRAFIGRQVWIDRTRDQMHVVSGLQQGARKVPGAQTLTA
jgi:hypothetical protein